MLENAITVRGANVEEAVEKGLKELGLRRDQVQVHVISEGSRGFLGFGRKDAIVEVRKDTGLSLKEITQKLEEIEEEPTQTPTPEPEEVEEEETKAEVKEPSSQEDSQVSDESVGEVGKNLENEEAFKLDTKELDDEENEEVATDQIDYEQARQDVSGYLEDVIETYGAQAQITSYHEGKTVVFEIETDKSGLVIGRHGQIINSLQVLAQVKLNNLYKRHVNVVLNVGDYRDRRSSVLDQMAERAAKKVLRTKQPVILEPLPSYERKQIHARLAKINNIKTHSEGREPNRYLVVEYKD